jgi:hypothetical protein
MKPVFRMATLLGTYVISTHVPDPEKGNYVVRTVLLKHSGYSVNAKLGQNSTLLLPFLDNYFEQIIDLGYDRVQRSDTKLD